MSTENTTKVYIIGPKDGPFKIGYSRDTRARLSQIQTGQAVEVMLHYEQETATSVAKVIEKMIHRQLGPQRIRGEWFKINLDEAIAEVQFAFIRWEDEPNLEFKFKRKLI